MKQKPEPEDDELRHEYAIDYSKATRGYFRSLLKAGTNVVVLEPDVARAFRDSASVNDALRSLLAIARAPQRQPARSNRLARKRAAA